MMRFPGFLNVFVPLLLVSITVVRPAASSEVVKSTILEAVWEYDNEPTPDTHWSPWLPLQYYGFRYKMGFRFSPGTIVVRAPFKVTFRYDPADAIPGKWMDIHVKLEPQLPANGNKFLESAFGIYIPNKIDVGFGAGLGGVGSIGLGWKRLSLDMWDMIALVPAVGGIAASAKENIGVNISGRKKPPLGMNQYTFNDNRTLLNIDATMFLSSTNKSKMVNKIYSKVPSGVRSLLSEKTAKKIIGKGLTKAFQAISLIIKGNPNYKIQGGRTTLHLLASVAGSGNTSVSRQMIFNSPGEEQTLSVYVPFPEVGQTTANNKLKINFQRLDWEMMLKQKLDFTLCLSMFSWNGINSTKTIHNGPLYVSPSGGFSFETPVLPTPPIADFHTHAGVKSASVFWRTLHKPTKGTLKVKKGSQVVKTVTESAHKHYHHLIVDGLQAGTAYQLVLEAKGEDQSLLGPDSISLNTQPSSKAKSFSTNISPGLGITNISASATQNSVTVSWKTPVKASTEVFFSTSDDYALSYVAAIKTTTGVDVGYLQSSHTRKLEKNHSITIHSLEPGKTYYYSIVSWTFKNDNPADDGVSRSEVANRTISTNTPPPEPFTKVKVSRSQGGVLSGQPVQVFVGSQQQPAFTVLTGTDGWTKSISLEKTKQYRFRTGGDCYSNTPEYVKSVSSSAQGSQGTASLVLNPVPAPEGIITDAWTDQAVSGATVKITGSGTQTTTNSQGRYALSWASEGTKTLQVSKSGYITRNMSVKVNECGHVMPHDIELLPQKARIVVDVTGRTDTGSTPVKTTLKFYKNSTTYIGSKVTDDQGHAVYEYTPPASGITPVRITAVPYGTNATTYMNTEGETSIERGSRASVKMVFDRKDTSPPQWTKFNVSRKGDGWELDWEADEAAKLTLKIDDSSFGGENTLYQAAKYEMDGIQSFRPSDSWLRGRIGENLKLIAILKDGNGNRTQPKIQFLGKGSPPDADIKISPNKDVFAPTEEITVSAKFNKGSYSHHYLEYNAKNMTDRDKKEAGCRRTGRVYKCTFLDTGSRQLKLTVADKKRYAAVFLQRTVTIKNLPVAQLTIKNKKNTYAEGQKLRVHIKASDSASKDGEVEAKLTMYWEITRNGKRQKFQEVIFRKMGGAVDSEIKKEVPESGSKVKLVLEVTDGDGLVNSKSVDFLVTEAERKEQKIEKKQENTKKAEEEKEQDTKAEEKAQQKEDKKQKSRRKKKKQIQKKKEKDIKTNPTKR